MEVKKLTEDEIKARIRPVCICKGIKQSVICDAIKRFSFKTVEQVNQRTGSGSGGCQGKRCRPVIEKLIARNGELLLYPHKTESEDTNDEDEEILMVEEEEKNRK